MSHRKVVERSDHRCEEIGRGLEGSLRTLHPRERTAHSTHLGRCSRILKVYLSTRRGISVYPGTAAQAAVAGSV